jgi:hypothetical protein
VVSGDEKTSTGRSHRRRGSARSRDPSSMDGAEGRGRGVPQDSRKVNLTSTHPRFRRGHTAPHNQQRVIFSFLGGCHLTQVATLSWAFLGNRGGSARPPAPPRFTPPRPSQALALSLCLTSLLSQPRTPPKAAAAAAADLRQEQGQDERVANLKAKGKPHVGTRPRGREKRKRKKERDIGRITGGSLEATSSLAGSRALSPARALSLFLPKRVVRSSRSLPPSPNPATGPDGFSALSRFLGRAKGRGCAVCVCVGWWGVGGGQPLSLAPTGSRSGSGSGPRA